MIIVLEAENTDQGIALAQCLKEETKHLSCILSVGIGRPYTAPADLHRSFVEAEEALHIGRALGEAGQITAFSNLGLFHWLYHLPPECQEDNIYLQKVNILFAHDTAHHSDLLPTLEAYLDRGGNALQTAKDLFIHRNTLLYRLAKIEKLCQIDLTDPLERLNMQVAIKNWRLQRLQRDG